MDTSTQHAALYKLPRCRGSARLRRNPLVSTTVQSLLGMYPADYYGLFPPFAYDETVFVAMSFDERFTPRYDKVISAAIDDVGLKPTVVRVGKVSDSILTKILEGIGRSRLVFADISSMPTDSLSAIPFRNGNVMYELGIAHAIRLPCEVVTFRSDNDPLLFDVLNVRVNRYDPDRAPKEARGQVADAIRDALSETDLRKAATVRRATDALDYAALAALTSTPEAVVVGKRLGIAEWHHVLPAVARSQEGYGATRRLLELGLLKTEYKTAKLPRRSGAALDWQARPIGEVLQPRLTRLGEAVLMEVGRRFLSTTQ